MAHYELGVRGGSGSSGVAQAELRAPAGASLYIYEIGIFLSAATASTLGIGRPANTPAGGTLTLGQGVNQDDPAATGGIVTTGWTTAPTAPTQFTRRIALPATIGNGIIWSFGSDGFRVKAGTSFVVWNIAASAAADIYICWHE